jgi:uncharacterized membrane protein YidH (DUF202 family)
MAEAGRDDSTRARDHHHLANERNFLAWVRTGLAVVVFGFAIGRFAIAILRLMEFDNITSTIKARRASFHDCIDTEDMFKNFFAKLRKGRVIP